MAEALRFLIQHLGALPLLAGALVLGITAVLAVDHFGSASPQARLRARLRMVMARTAAGGDEDEAEADRALFLAQRRDLRGRIAAWLAELSLAIGGPARLRTLWALSAGCALVGTVAASALLGVSPPFAAALGALAGAVGFRLASAEMRRVWALAFLDQMVEAVELMTRSVRSGFTPGAAIRIVSTELPAPAGPVFGRIADEDELGLDLRVSLRRAARRIALPDFNFLAVALILQRETGGQLADTLDGLHLMLRRRREARLKLLALTSEGRMSATILSALPFVAGAGVAFASPDKFALLFEPGLGRTMLAYGGVSLLSGIVIMRWMVAPRA